MATPTSTPVPAGRIEGYIAADNVPAHQQFGDVGASWCLFRVLFSLRAVQLVVVCTHAIFSLLLCLCVCVVSIKPGRQYLVVKVEAASRLRAADERIL